VNAPEPGLNRRGFLTRLFAEPDNAPGKTALRAVPELRQHFDGVLWAAAGTSSNDLFVAGDDGNVFHYDGERWSKEVFPSKLPVHSLCLLGDKVYSVGWLGRICERVDGQWRAIQGGSNVAATENLPLFEIAADSKGHLWAVGDEGRIVQFDGDTWLEHHSGTSANLRSVLPLADGRVLVAGAGGTVLLQTEDGNWSTVESGTGCSIVSMAQLGDEAVIAVGGEYDIESGGFLGRIFLYNEGQWQAVESELPLPRLRRVRNSGDCLLICGDDGTAFRWTADGARRLPTRLRYDLHDLFSSPYGDVLICGDGGTLLRECAADSVEDITALPNTKQWRKISDGETKRTLRTIWPIGGDHLIAAGDGGTLLHIEGETISAEEVPGGLRIHDIWGSSPRNVFAACDNATILHFDGETWDIAHRGSVDTALLAIYGFGAHDIFAVGDSGYALRYDGLMWRQIETGVQQELYGLWGQDSQHVLAIGGGGLILRWNGERWKSFSAGTDQDLYGVTGSGLNKLYIAGLAGTIVRFEDNAWHRDFSGVRSDLHSVTGCDGAYYAVGSSGTVLCNLDGTWHSEPTGIEATLQAIFVTDTHIYTVGSGGVVLKRSR
jgi:photosystem II stability/assembly factor-like uncharacterized protein